MDYTLNDREYRKFRDTSNGDAVAVIQTESPPTDSSKVNASMTISNTDTTVTSTKVITKTIGATSYTKTLSMNVAGDVVSVSAWS